MGKAPDGQDLKAERFDFSYLENFYKPGMQIDEYGERIMTQTNNYSRIVSKEYITIDDHDKKAEEERKAAEAEAEEAEGSEEEDGEEGTKKGPKKKEKKKPTPVIPVVLLNSVFYFQYRIDMLPPKTKYPRIIVGLCRKDFESNQDLSRHKEVWALNLATGDKFGERKWKDYYNIVYAEKPDFGYFI